MAALCSAVVCLPTAHADDSPGARQASKRGKVRITHEAKKVLACEKVEEDGAHKCRPSKLEPAKSGAKLKLNPIAAGDDEGKASSDSLTFDLDDKPGKQAHTVSLRPGNWELVWEGAAVLRDKFSVQESDEFDVALETQQGVCKPKADQCVVEAGKKHQSVEIPTERGL